MTQILTVLTFIYIVTHSFDIHQIGKPLGRISRYLAHSLWETVSFAISEGLGHLDFVCSKLDHV